MPNGAISGSGQRVGSSDQGEGRLSPEYYRATIPYLGDNYLPADVIEQVAAILGDFVEEGAAEDETTVGTRGTFKGYAQDSRRRQMATDALLPPSLRRWPDRPMTSRQAASYAERFPDAAKIRVV